MRDIDGAGYHPDKYQPGSNPEANAKQEESILLTADGTEPSVCQCCLEEDPAYLLGYKQAMIDAMAKVITIMRENTP